MMHFFRQLTALALAAALLLSGCSRTGSPAAENSHSENSAPVSERFDPLAVGLLGHTDQQAPLSTQPLEEDLPLTEALIRPNGLEGQMLRVCVYDSAGQGYTLTRYPAAGGETAGQLVQTALSALYPDGEGIALTGLKMQQGFAVWTSPSRRTALPPGAFGRAGGHHPAQHPGLHPSGKRLLPGWVHPGWGGLLAGRRDPGGRWLGKIRPCTALQPAHSPGGLCRAAGAAALARVPGDGHPPPGLPVKRP